MNKKFIIFLFLINLFLAAFLYRNSFSSYFFQDDWFTFKISAAKNAGDFLAFFVPRTDVIYYRPLGMQVFFFIMQSLFGINPLPFRIITLFTHAGVSLLLALIVVRLTKSVPQAFVVSFMYAVSAVFFIPYYWASTYPFVLGPFFFFLSFLLYLESKSRKTYLFSFSFFLMGALTNEMVLVLPVVLLLYEWLLADKKKIGRSLAYLLGGFIFFLLRFLFFKPPTSGLYHLEISKSVLHNLLGYGMWAINWPEEMKAQMVTLGKFNSQFVQEFGFYYYVFVISLVLLIFISLIFPFIAGIRKGEIRHMPVRIVFFGVTWFILGLITVLFFPVHSFSYYLPISLAGFLIGLTSFIIAFCRKNPLLEKSLFVFLFLVWFIVSLVTVEFNERVHWAAKRGKNAKNLIHLAAGQTVVGMPVTAFYVPDTSENKLSLNDQDALQVVFGNSGIITVYGAYKDPTTPVSIIK